MKIICCYIENFGKLHQVKYEWQKGLNVFIQENGYGKTTLALFIRSMFYGFPKDTKINKDRKKYQPWNGGNYGGHLDFEVDQKTYRVIRFFGNSLSSDKFQLLDLQTLLPTDDYSSNLGEELFHLNITSYSNVLFHYQNQLVFESGENIDSLLHGFQQMNEFESYDEAMEILKDYIMAYGEHSKRKQVRSLKVLNDLYTQKSQAMIYLTSLKEELDIKKKGIADLQSSLSFNEEQRKLIAKQIQNSNRNNELYYIQKEYDRLKNEQNDIHVDQELLLIDEDELKQYTQLALVHFQKEDNHAELTEKEASILYEYNLHPYTSRQLNQLNMLLEQYKEERNQLAAIPLTLEERAKKQEYTKLFKYLDLNGLLQLENKSLEINHMNKIKLLCMIIGGLLSIIGIVLLFFIGLYGFISIVCGIIVCIYGWYSFNAKKEEKQLLHVLDELTHSKNRDCAKTITDLKEKYQILKSYQERDELSKKAIDPILIDKINAIFEEIGLDIDEDHWTEQYYQMRFNFDTIQMVKTKDHDLQIDQANYDQEAKMLDEYLERINIQFTDNYYFTLQHLVEKYERNKLQQKRLIQLLNEQDELTQPYGSIDFDENRYEYINIDDLINQYQEYDNTELQKRMQEEQRQYEQSCAQYAYYLDEVEEAKSIKEEIEALSYKVNCVDKASYYLEKTNSEFNSQYNDHILSTFKKYYQLITDEDHETIMIDANKNIIYDHHSVETLSEGNKDLVYLCMRLTMIELLFTNEQPVLIFDDPFTNLDDKRVQNGLKLLQKVANDYQVVYFTCHYARTRG